MFKKAFILILLLPLFCTAGIKEYIFPVFSFTERYFGVFPDGGGLLQVGGYLYGATSEGGSHDLGTIFRIKRDGSDHQVLYHFTGDAGTNWSGRPKGQLILDGGIIYGVGGTHAGSGNSGGSVFCINVDGTGFKVLTDFYDGTGNFINGKEPGYAGVVLVDGVLYGSTRSGGNNDYGVIFAVNKDGSNFRKLHDFTVSSEQGRLGRSGVTYYKGRLYGSCRNGGKNDEGTIYSIKPDGTEFTVIHHNTDALEGRPGSSPVTVVDDFIYVSSYSGGANNKGTVFRIKIDGTELKILHTFKGTDGWNPGEHNDLLSLGDYMYGATERDNVGLDSGVLFRVKKDGTDFEVLDFFSDEKGSVDKGNLLYDPPYLYGLADYGGTANSGTLFRYKLGYLYSVVTYSPEAGLTTAKLWGNAWKKEDHDILEKGFCWGESSNPDMDDNVKVAGKGEGKFVGDIYSLNPGKTYYVRAYVKTALGTFYGENMSFRSPHPKVSGTVMVDGQPAAGVVVEFPGRETLVTNSSGMFSTEVYYGWTGVVKFSKENVDFTKSEYSFSNLKENSTIECTGNTKE